MRCTRSLFLVVLATALGCAAVHDRAPEPDAATMADAAATMADAASTAPDAARSDSGVTDMCAERGGIGSACSTDAECTVHATFSPAICLPPGRGASMGYCTSICMVDSECGACGRCVANMTGTSPAPGWYGLCVRACDATRPCDAGYVCASIDSARDGCFPDCRLEPGLCGGARCNATTGSCDVGCATDADCSDGSSCVGGRCECGPSTACMAGSRCGPVGECGCADASACGPGHACDSMVPCCEWSAGLCG